MCKCLGKVSNLLAEVINMGLDFKDDKGIRNHKLI